MNRNVLLEQYLQHDKNKCKRDEVEHCKKFIEKYYRPVKKINVRCPTAYTLKHYVENWCGEYIPMSAFVTAAVELGFDIKLYFRPSFRNPPKPYPPSVRLNIGLKLEENGKYRGWAAHQKEFG